MKGPKRTVVRKGKVLISILSSNTRLEVKKKVGQIIAATITRPGTPGTSAENWSETILEASARKISRRNSFTEIITVAGNEIQITKSDNCTIYEEISETFEISKKPLAEKTPNIQLNNCSVISHFYK